MDRQPPHGVAPAELIRQDFRVLDARDTLRTTWPNEQLILLQSVQGHAHEGHGVFRGRRFPDTTLDDVTLALRLNPTTIQAERQALIDGITAYADLAMSGAAPGALIDGEAAPLLGVSTLRFLKVDPADVLRGLYLGGLRDDSDVRRQVEQERRIRIGRGKCYFVDFRRAREVGLTGDALARGEWESRIASLQSEGVIVAPERRHAPDVAWQYVRHEKGPGASDDAAIVAAGMLWGLGVAVGVFLADAIDTLEKYAPAYSDQDAELAVRIESGFAGLDVGRQEVRLLTFLAAVPEGQEGEVPDSSLRHLLAIDVHRDLCPLEAHLLAVQGVPAPDVALAHERLPSSKFYRYVRQRIADAK